MKKLFLVLILPVFLTACSSDSDIVIGETVRDFYEKNVRVMNPDGIHRFENNGTGNMKIIPNARYEFGTFCEFTGEFSVLHEMNGNAFIVEALTEKAFLRRGNLLCPIGTIFMLSKDDIIEIKKQQIMLEKEIKDRDIRDGKKQAEDKVLKEKIRKILAE
jgi:hypothetical protein